MKPRRIFFGCFLALVATFPGMATGQPTNAVGAAKRLDAEYRKLNDSVVGKEMAELNAKLSAIYQSQEKDRQALLEQMNKLRQSDACRGSE